MCDIQWSPDNRTIHATFVSTTKEDSQRCVVELSEYMKKVLDNGNMFTMRVDTRQMHTSPGFSSVRLLIAFMKAYRPKCAAQMMGSAIVIENSVIRWLVNTMFSLHPPSSPVTLVATMDEADSYIARAIDGVVQKNASYSYTSNSGQESLLSAEDRVLLEGRAG